MARTTRLRRVAPRSRARYVNHGYRLPRLGDCLDHAVRLRVLHRALMRIAPELEAPTPAARPG